MAKQIPLKKKSCLLSFSNKKNLRKFAKKIKQGETNKKKKTSFKKKAIKLKSESKF